jgi:polyphosphate glucokinase
MQQAAILGIDVGATGLKGALIDIRTGKLITERHRIPTPQPATPEAVIAELVNLVKHFEWKGTIGLGFPSVIVNGEARTAANIDESWIGKNVEQMLSEHTGCAVKALNDADAAGIAELYFGAGDGQKGLFMLITVGTGLGSAVIADGVLVPNTELGHLQFEKKVAEKYISESVRKKENLSWEEYGKRLNKYLKHLERLFSPDMIILGGGGSKHFEKYSKQLKPQYTKIIPAQMLNDAGIIGAAYYAYHKVNQLELKGVI